MPIRSTVTDEHIITPGDRRAAGWMTGDFSRAERFDFDDGDQVGQRASASRS